MLRYNEAEKYHIAKIFRYLFHGNYNFQQFLVIHEILMPRKFLALRYITTTAYRVN